MASCLLEVFQYQHNPTVQQIWTTLEQQLAACTECINGLHTAQVGALAQGMQDSATMRKCGQVSATHAGVVSAHLGHSHWAQQNCPGSLQAALFDEFESTRPLLEVLWQLDKQRLLAWAALPPPQQQPQAAAGDMLSTQQLHALFELLGYSHYLDDAELCSAAVGLLHHVSWALETSEGTPYAGLLRLLAHPDSHVRSQVIRRLLQDCTHHHQQQQREVAAARTSPAD